MNKKYLFKPLIVSLLIITLLSLITWIYIDNLDNNKENDRIYTESINGAIFEFNLTFKDVKTWRTLDNFFSVGPNGN